MRLFQLATLVLPLLLAANGAAAQEPGETWLAVGPSRLLEAVAPLVEHRGSQGLVAEVWATDADPAARREEIAARVRDVRPRFLLLVGDVDEVPTFEVREAVTDRPYGDLDGDGYPEVAIGRLPFSDPTVLTRLVERILDYERAPDPGLWRKQLSLVAGEGRFSPAIDGLIEKLFQQVVAEGVAPGYDVDLTYANPRSPYCYPPEAFSDRVVSRLQEGALVFAYVGHGQVQSVDRLTVPVPGARPKAYEVLDARRAPDLAGTRAPPIFMAIACWTGKFEGPQECIGESLLRAPGGPVAFFGSSRISHPVQNALLAKELVRALLSDTGPVRLGPALDAARRAMAQGTAGPDPVRLQVLGLAQMFVGAEQVAAEMPRHVDMYNLLGDPALAVARPEAEVALEVGAAAPGEDLLVRGRAPLAGMRLVTLSLERPRDSVPMIDPAATSRERYARANERTVRALLVTTGEDGAFEARLPLPADLPPGAYVLKAYAPEQGGRRCAIGAATLRIVAQ